MDAIEQLESELKVLDGPPPPRSESVPTTQQEPSPPMSGDDDTAKRKAAEQLAAALDNLHEYVGEVRTAAHSLVEALSPVESTGHLLAVGEPAEEPTNPKEPEEDEVPQES